MALFDKKNSFLEFLEEDKLKERGIKIPENIELEKDNDSLFVMLLNTVLELGDESDLEIILKSLATNFFISNEDMIFYYKVLEYDDIRIIIKCLNKILNFYNLGTVQLIIDENKKIVRIYHYNNFFKKLYLERKDYFFITFYTLFFKKLLNKNVKIEEEGNDNEKVIFKIDT